jgi:hypothetical protein
VRWLLSYNRRHRHMQSNELPFREPRGTASGHGTQRRRAEAEAEEGGGQRGTLAPSHA